MIDTNPIIRKFTNVQNLSIRITKITEWILILNKPDLKYREVMEKFCKFSATKKKKIQLAEIESQIQQNAFLFASGSILKASEDSYLPISSSKSVQSLVAESTDSVNTGPPFGWIPTGRGSRCLRMIHRLEKTLVQILNSHAKRFEINPHNLICLDELVRKSSVLPGSRSPWQKSRRFFTQQQCHGSVSRNLMINLKMFSQIIEP